MSPAPSDVVLELFEADNTTAVTVGGQALALPFEAGTCSASQFVSLSKPGSIKFTMLAEPGATQWTHLRADRVIRLKYRGNYIAAYRPTVVRQRFIGGGAKRVEVEGVDLLTSLLADARLLLKPGTEPFAGALEKRLMGWQDRDYDHSWWVDPDRGDYTYPPEADVDRPETLFSPFVRWYGFPFGPGGGLGATILARRNFHLDEAKIIVPRVAAKGGMRAWVDSVPVGETPMPPHGDARKRMHRWAINMPAGAHTLSFEVVGAPGERPEFLAEVYAVDDVNTGACTADTLLFQTDDADPWKVAWVAGGDRPGLTAGGILRDFLTEADARDPIPPITLHFTKEEDSNGNEWPVLRQEVVFDVNNPLIEAARQLAEADCDLWMAPTGLNLYATRHGERGNFWTNPAAPPVLSGGRDGGYGAVTGPPNLVELTWTRYLTPDEVRFIYQHRDGYGVSGTTGPERGYQFGNLDPTAAAELADQLRALRSLQLDTASAEMIPSRSDTLIPEHAGLGDAVRVPQGAPGSETFVAQRLVGITIDTNSSRPGAAKLLPELGSAESEFLSDLDARVTRMRAGDQYSASIRAPETLGTPIKGGEATTGTMVFNKRGPLNEGDMMSDKYPFPMERVKLYQAESLLSEVSIDGVQLGLYQNGVWFQWIEIPAGAASDEAKIDLIGNHIGKGPQDYVQVNLEEPGTGSEGLTVTLRYTEPL